MALSWPKALAIGSAPWVYLKLLRALYFRCYRSSPALADALGCLVRGESERKMGLGTY